MCDRCCQSCWSKDFYRQYLEQHSSMMQWFHQGIQSYQEYLPEETPAVSHHLNPCSNYQTEQLHQGTVQWNDCSAFVPNHQNHTNQSKRNGEFLSSTDESLSGESEVSRDDIIGSDDEICFDPTYLLELRRNKESFSEKSDSDDDNEQEEEFEYVDSVIEEFEYVQLDKFGNMSENRKGRKGRPHAENEMKMEREIREYLYGEKADTIAGLETAMNLDFNRLCDLYQPHLWPVLPVCLSKV